MTAAASGFAGPSAVPPTGRLAAALSACRAGLRGVALHSFAINLLMLAAPLYMLQVFDRVIAGRSLDTLFYLTLIALLAFLAMAALEAVRARTLIKLGGWLDQRLGGDLLSAEVLAAGTNTATPSAQGLRDLTTLRNFLTGASMFPILDAPWTPLFLIVIFLLHPVLGLLAAAGAVTLFALAVANDLGGRRALERAGTASRAALSHAEAAARNADAILAMGVLPNLVRRWRRANGEMLHGLGAASRRSATIGAVSKFLRMALQIGILGTGAWLVLAGELTAGGMIAGSILLGRALAPVDQAISSWKSAVTARQAYRRIADRLAVVPPAAEAMPLPVPRGRLTVENLTYAHPDASEPLLRGVNLRLEPGESLGLIGPTAAGKTTLARLIVGNLRPQVGHVRLDGADIWQWDAADRGPYVGYLPQDVELFQASVRDNIARLGAAEGEAVVAAARLAQVHDMILRLPQGYETPVGDGGAALSGGQRQRIALARAVFGPPRLVVLDEPNANLDQEGEAALLKALGGLKAAGVTNVVIAHRPSVLRHVDKILVLRPGQAPAFGPRDEILQKVTGPTEHGTERGTGDGTARGVVARLESRLEGEDVHSERA